MILPSKIGVGCVILFSLIGGGCVWGCVCVGGGVRARFFFFINDNLQQIHKVYMNNNDLNV